MAEKIWQYLDALSHKKDRSVLDDPQFAKDYVPFIINRALSYHQDAVLSANMMNERPWLDAASQFQFLLNTLAARKRFSKWIKATVPNDAKSVAEYYGCSIRHARNIVDLHTKEQMKIIRSRLEKGGAATKAGSRHDNT
jgi:hypothetical protein